jgi:hypothetical protein
LSLHARARSIFTDSPSTIWIMPNLCGTTWRDLDHRGTPPVNNSPRCIGALAAS